MSAATEQRESALVIANRVRMKRAECRREIVALPMKEGRRKVARLLDNPPDWLLTERIGRLLCWPKYTGKAFAHRMVVRASPEGWPMAESKRVGSLTATERKRLAKTLREGWNPDA